MTKLKHHKVEEGVYKLVDGEYVWIHHRYKGSFDPHELDKALALLDELNKQPGRVFTHYRRTY